MLNKVLIITGLTLLFVFASATRLTQAETLMLQISVTIPEIPGVNVPPYDDDLEQLAQLETVNETFDITEEEVFRGNQWVLLKTITVR